MTPHTHPSGTTFFAICDTGALLTFAMGAASAEECAKIRREYYGRIAGEYDTWEQAFAEAQHAMQSCLDSFYGSDTCH